MAYATSSPCRCNVVALVPGDAGDVILWDAHQDTVSTAGMSVNPFAAETNNGRIYGRGACDVKGAMSAMICAAASASRRPTRGRPNLLLSFTVNEECGFTGAESLATFWRDGRPAHRDTAQIAGNLSIEQLTSLRPSRAIVAEPTSLNVVVAHRGVVRWRCRTLGRAAHSSQPDLGLNAISAMADVVRAVGQFHDEQLSQRADALCGPSTAVVTTIRGGSGPNTVPDEAVVDIDRRLTREESPQQAYEELTQHLMRDADLKGCRIEHDPPWMQSSGLSDAENRPWAEAVATVARGAGTDARIMGVPYGTNAATIASAGIPTVVFGPGSINQAHTADEWIAVDQLEQSVEIYRQLAASSAAL